MIFRLSKTLNTKIGAGALPKLPLNENPFADWSAHLFVADRTQYILLSNTKSLYSAVLFGKGINDDSRFIERALSTFGSSWKAMGRRSSTDDSSHPHQGRSISPGHWIVPSQVP